MTNPLAKKYGTQKRWLNWRLETRAGKQTKVPYQINGKLAKSTDPNTWATYEEAKSKSDKVGIVLHDGLLVGFDFDHVLTDGVLAPEYESIIAALDTYCEVSQSHTGLHAYLAIVGEPVTLTANRATPVEIYVTGRYLTVTGEPFGIPRDIRTVSRDEALRLIELLVPQKKEPSTSGTSKLTDEEVQERMFAASNGADIQALWNGDTSKYASDASRADMALATHLAFWCAKDAAQIERLWLLSQLGARGKVKERDDYRKRTVGAAIDCTTEVYDPKQKGESEVPIGDARLGLLFAVKDKHKAYYKNTENISRVLARHPEFKGTLRFDTYRAVIERKINGVWRLLEDRDAVDVQTRISVLYSDFATIGKEMVYDALVKVAYDQQIDSGADYLRALVWDKVPRLDSWLSKAYHTPLDDYHKTVGANWLKGLVRRIMMPGSKFDYVLVLEGAQGIRKSTSLMLLAGSLGHAETTISTDQKDFFMLLSGNAIVEFSEGETLSRTEVKQMKAVITMQIDKYRQPYGRTIIEHPRRCVFAMTTNQSEYLKDETGNRRWLPVAVEGNVNIEWIAENREQVLAEAYHRVMVDRETTWEFPEDELKRQQEMRRLQSPNTERIVTWYIALPDLRRAEGVTSADIFQNALNGGFASRPMTRMEEMDIADVCRTQLHMEQRRLLADGVQTRKWYATPSTLSFLALALPENF